jgi:hypothetical protein
MLRVWSAGCATGEEAYSLAACLQAQLHGSPIVLSVLGTDALGDRVEQASKGTYGRFSVRESAPLMYPVLEKARNGEHQVPRKIRSVTRFLTHDFRNGPPDDGGAFDVIFCRNVLVYFSPEGARDACAQLALALAPEGLLAFGPTDIGVAPPGLTAVGPSGLNCFTKLAKRAPAVKKAPAPAAAPEMRVEPEKKSPVPSPRKLAPDRSKDWSHAIALHLVALRYIERGDEKKALEGLTEMSRLYADYLPGVLENALFQARRGHRQKAIELMTSILERASSMAADLDIPGPEILPASYYVASAEAYLGELATRKKLSR